MTECLSCAFTRQNKLKEKTKNFPSMYGILKLHEESQDECKQEKTTARRSHEPGRCDGCGSVMGRRCGGDAQSAADTQ